jgi:hypothetical protein
MEDRNDWTTFLNFYTGQNAGRRTRLGVFELSRDVVNDYWIEDGLPLVALDAETTDEGRRAVRIMVGEMAHDVRDAIKLVVHLTSYGYEDGIDLLDRDNRVTLLRFEKMRYAEP